MSTEKTGASRDLAAWLSQVRRDLHMHPETAYEEVRTTERIRAILTELGVENQGFDDLTGAVGLIRGSQPGRTIALRADIDALPVEEMNQAPYRSKHEGRMHACGHDAHTTIMLGVAKNLVESGLVRELKGNVKLLFQPAEEGGGGAQKMIERGVLENPRVDRVVACHMLPELEVGRAGLFRGQSHASADRFSLVIKGRGAHGGRPHQGLDPIVAGAHFVTALQSVVGRNIDPLEAAVITVGRFSAGRAANVIPEEAELGGTIRALRQPVRERLWHRISEIARGIEQTFQVGCELALLEGYPPCVNDEEVSTFLYEISAEVLGPDKVEYMPPSTGAEDFAYFALERPGAMMRLGCGNGAKGLTHPLHSPHFDLDEAVLSFGVEIFSRAVQRFLA